MGIFSKSEERTQNFVTEFLRVSGDRRLEMIASLYRNTNRLLLIPRARSISDEIRKRRAPFQALYDFETGLARTAHPGRRWHPGAQYFYASYFKDRAESFRTDLHNLSAGGRLNGAALVPLIARMDYSDGRSFVLLFFEEILRPLNAGLTNALKSIEVDHHRLKDGLQHDASESPDPAAAENRRRVLEDFEAFRKKSPELSRLYLLRAEADPLLAPYLPELRKIEASAEQAAAATGAEQPQAFVEDPATAGAIDAAASPPPDTASAATQADAADANNLKESEESEKSEESQDSGDSGGGPADAGMATNASVDADAHAHAAADADANADANTGFEIAPEQASDENAALTPDSDADVDDQNAFAVAPQSAPVPDGAFEIAGPAAPESDDSLAAMATPAADSETAAEGADATLENDSESPEAAREFEEFLAARRAEMEDIERRLNQGLEECQQEIEAIGRVADPVERVDESQAALLADDQYQHYRADLQEILADADQLFARIFALLSKLARRLTVAEMRRFVDHLIEELSQDEAILTREPHLIPRLQNYRNSLREDAPRLLNQIHAQLAEIRRECGQDQTRALREQLEYLQARLTDSLFRSIWPTIFTIYQNLVAQEFDAHVFREISEHLPLERQQRMLAALREGFQSGGPARAAIERKLRGAELAGIGERIQRETATGEVEELPEILARLETNHRFDPVERVREEIREFDAGRPSPTQSQTGRSSPAVQEDASAANSGAGKPGGDAHSEAEAPLDPNQESGWTVERTRALHRTRPDLALEFAGRALSAGEVDAREKELLCELIEELSERDAAMARLYIFHRSVESAGDPRAQLAMIRKFQQILPDAVVQTRESNLRRAVARAPVPGLLNRALKESDRTRRSQQLRVIVKNPHLPGGVRRALQARRDTPADAAFQTAFDSICISPHPAKNKIQLLQTLGALAKARGWLSEQRVRKLEDRIRLYRRISQANQTTAARTVPERRFFARNSAALLQKLRAGRPPAEILKQRDREVYGVAPAPEPTATAQQAKSAAPTRASRSVVTHRKSPTSTTTSTTAKTITRTKSAARSTQPVPMTVEIGAPSPTSASASASPGPLSNASANSNPDNDSSPTVEGRLDQDFMNTPIELEHSAPGDRQSAGAKRGAGSTQQKTRAAAQAGGAKSTPVQSTSAAHKPGSSANTGSAKPGGTRAESGGFFGKLLSRVSGKKDAGGGNKDGKQETISIARLTTRAEKLFLKGDRRDPQQLLEILHTPEDLLELLQGMPEMKKNPAAKRDKAAEAIKSAIAVTVIVPKKNRVLGMPGSLCFPRKDWNNELKRKNLVKSLNALAEKQLPGSEKYNYYKFLAEEIQFNYYQGKYKHGRI
ncbi:MAG: hypothetical protein NXI24_04170 [bacterium]|nr:hypothetical protein [bacterium]